MPALHDPNKPILRRPRKYWMALKRRQQEAIKSFDTLCKVRDNRVYEQKFVKNSQGEWEEVEVVPSVRVVVDACCEILDRTVGKAKQEIELTNPGGTGSSMVLVINRPIGTDATKDRMVEIFTIPAQIEAPKADETPESP